jgi:BirA family biotin operon repressor/biotin-[acetyl-CoA-carboxylase] ligase
VAVSAARILRHETVDSTNERAFAALAEGSARHGDVHLARAQSAGRGRQGRRWESPLDEGLYASVVLLPPPPAPDPAALTMAAGLAVLEAVRALGLARARLEWPNDLVVDQSAAPGSAPAAKLAGVLVEARGLDPRRPHAVLGIGVNVRQRSFPSALSAERSVTSLALEGLEAGPEQVLRGFLEQLFPLLEAAREAPEELAREYLAATGLRGARVRLERAQGAELGTLEGLDLREGLALRRDDGTLVRAALAHVRALERA